MNFAKEILAQHWNEWQIVEQIGQGTYGKVYKIKREYLGDREQFSALKVIRIPSADGASAFAFGTGSFGDSKDYYRSLVTSIVREIELMAKVKGHTNIVSYEDHKVIENSDDSWTILIRMELLTPLSVYLGERFMSEEEAVRLGSDICKALEVCSKLRIIHRDIKAENVFVSETGDFKLGDFGTARISEKTLDAGTMAGTYPYMAPEMIRQEPYGAGADIYSLGILLYRLMNKNRLPFYPRYPAEIKHDDVQRAFQKRLSGEAPDSPSDASEKLADIILRACEFSAENRFASASAMRKAIEELYTPVIYDPAPKKNKNRSKKGEKGKNDKKKTAIAIAACALGLIAVVSIAFAAVKSANTKKFIAGELEADGFIYDDYNTEIHITGFTECPDELIIPSEIGGTPVTWIMSEAFANLDITSLTVSQGITFISDCAFINCADLERVSLPSTLYSIGERAFADCVSLEEIAIPNSVKDIGSRAFEGCEKLSSVTAGELYVKGEDAFNGTPYLNNREAMLGAYEAVLSENEESEYLLYDMDSDGIEELIVRADRSNSIKPNYAYYQIFTYIYKENDKNQSVSIAKFPPEAKHLKEFYANYDCLCIAKDENGFYGYTIDDGYETVELITFDGKKISKKNLKDNNFSGGGELPGEKLEFTASASDSEPLKKQIFKVIEY